MMNDKLYCCTTYRKYCYLTDSGFTVISIKKHKTDPKKLVWFFEDSKELQDAVTYYYANYDNIQVQ